MEKIDRRNFMAVSGLALALGACGKRDAADRDCDRSTETYAGRASLPGSFQSALGFYPKNHGLDHTTSHPGIGAKLKADGSQPPQIPEGNRPPFRPEHVALFHFELILHPTQASLKARSAHFAADRSGNNDWDANRPKIAQVINYLNGTSSDSTMILKENLGFDKLKFKKGQHHVVVYIKNKGLSFLRGLPLLFGDALIDKSKAEKNGSFFDCATKQDIIGVLQDSMGGCANEAVYMKNYFHRYDETRGVQEINDSKSYMYSMNFLTTLSAADDKLLLIPVIFDPDTGNMGGGGGYP